MENWLSFTAYIVKTLYSEGYKYFVFENSPKLTEISPLGKEKITISAKYLCRVYPFKEKKEGEQKAHENENNYILDYGESLVSLANTRHFVAVIVV